MNVRLQTVKSVRRCPLSRYHLLEFSLNAATVFRTCEGSQSQQSPSASLELCRHPSAPAGTSQRLEMHLRRLCHKRHTTFRGVGSIFHAYPYKRAQRNEICMMASLLVHVTRSIVYDTCQQRVSNLKPEIRRVH
jgi:hypothetical protein